MFFFFDRYAIGGAQRIHLDILEAVQDVHKQIYFTRSSTDHSLKDVFFSIPNSINKDIHFWCDNLLIRPFTVHFYAFYLNRHKSAHVLSANSTFFYDILPFLKRHVIKTELLHNFTHGKNGMEFFGLANHKLLTNRIVYDSYTLNNIKEQYRKYNVSPSFLENIKFIEPGVYIPQHYSKEFSTPLKILYAGRGGAQKRIPLLNAIAEYCITQKLNVQFHFAGTMIDELSTLVKDHSVIYGAISTKEQMNELYSQSHIVLMTSAYEGFPMLIKESMAFGCVPVVTALEGNKMHLQHGKNALLIESYENGEDVIKQGISLISKLLHDPALLEHLSLEAYKYACDKFTKSKFISDYRKLLLID